MGGIRPCDNNVIGKVPREPEIKLPRQDGRTNFCRISRHKHTRCIGLLKRRGTFSRTDYTSMGEGGRGREGGLPTTSVSALSSIFSLPLPPLAGGEVGVGMWDGGDGEERTHTCMGHHTRRMESWLAARSSLEASPAGRPLGDSAERITPERTYSLGNNRSARGYLRWHYSVRINGASRW